MAEGLGEDLRSSTEAVLAGGDPPPPWDDQLRRFHSGLDRFEERGRQDRSRVVAHGLRICAALGTLGGEWAAAKPKAPAPELPRQAPDRPGRVAVTSLPGVGPKTAEKLAAKGIRTIEDLLYVLPLGYEDRRRQRTLDDVEEGERVLIAAKVKSFRQGWFRGRYRATMKLRQDAPSGPIDFEARWFHPVGGLAQRVETGTQVLLAGPAKTFRGGWSMVHPEILDPEGDSPSIAVRYPIVEGVGQGTLRRLCTVAIERLADVDSADPLPSGVVEAHGLPSQAEALGYLHRPAEDLAEEAFAELRRGSSAAHRRLAFEEFFFLQLALLQKRAGYRQRPCSVAALEQEHFDGERLRACVPFEPTKAQWGAIAEVNADLGTTEPMLRLLQGDVGSGKTVVAFAGAMAVVGAGAQAAMMAPTEILAEQHYRTLGPWCQKAGLSLRLLTAATPKAERKTLLALLAGGKIDLLVGTHSLIVGDVHFRQLGLAIVDEQHRFGVHQRSLLREKGVAPHLLVMTATPIPRSLALTAFGELDVSIIDELPPGRTPPKTKVFYGAKALGRARAKLCQAVEKGSRAFVVCPLVEASEVLDVSDVDATATALRGLMPEARVGVIHGRLHSRDKDAAMTAFRDGDLDVLVATTVIEVGVDVPEAKVILVEHAERFGLAQLHQLRGRVGRGKGTSQCFIHTANPKTSDVGQRLKVMEETNDGFAVAEHDLRLRGPGELFGTRQSGVPKLRFASFAGEGVRLLVEAREAAGRVLDGDPELERDPELGYELSLRTADGVYSAESG
jgi:ATP-dependent DNA helicase RecG